MALSGGLADANPDGRSGAARHTGVHSAHHRSREVECCLDPR